MNPPSSTKSKRAFCLRPYEEQVEYALDIIEVEIIENTRSNAGACIYKAVVTNWLLQSDKRNSRSIELIDDNANRHDNCKSVGNHYLVLLGNILKDTKYYKCNNSVLLDTEYQTQILKLINK